MNIKLTDKTFGVIVKINRAGGSVDLLVDARVNTPRV